MTDEQQKMLEEIKATRKLKPLSKGQLDFLISGLEEAWEEIEATEVVELMEEIERLREENFKNRNQPDVAKELSVWLRQYGIETPDGGYALNLPYIGPAIRELADRIEKAKAENEHLSSEIDLLASYFLTEHPEEITEGSAVEVAIKAYKKVEADLKQILDALQLKLQPGGSPPSGGPVILAAWIINEANAQIRELKEVLRDVLDAFWDMSPLEYARSRDLPEMSDAEGERILEKARRLVEEKEDGLESVT